MAEAQLLREGPYVWSVIHDSVASTRPCRGGQERPVKLPLTVTVPMASSPASAAPPGPFPVVCLLNGFQARASYYQQLARRLASWGVVVLQYNAPALTIIPDTAELPFLGVALSWLKQAATSETAQPALQGRADLQRLVVAGHSRGGKLAALHYAAGSVAGLPIRSAFLLDPVDNTRHTPESADYPSATKALKAAGRPFGLAAAGIISASNPEGSNWKLFEAAAPAGSWTLVLKRAGHTSFMQAPTGVEQWLLDRVFGGGRMDRDAVMSETAAAMVAWVQQQLSPAAPEGTGASGSDGGGGGGASGAGASLRAATGAAPVPLASTALSAAALASAGPAAAVAEAPGQGEEQQQQQQQEQEQQQQERRQFAERVRASFRAWITSPLAADDLEFRVKEGAAA